jgi:predicted nucleic acid-binding protein
MNDRFFVDTNILVYAYDDSAGQKHAMALSLLKEVLHSGAAIISTQVLQELVICLRRKVARPLQKQEIRKIVSELLGVGSFCKRFQIGAAFARDRRPI